MIQIGETITPFEASTTNPVDVTYNWYDANDTTTIIHQGEDFTPTNTNAGVYEYVVQAVENNANCESNLVTVSFTIYDFPQVSQLDDQIVCDGFTTNPTG